MVRIKRITLYPSDPQMPVTRRVARMVGTYIAGDVHLGRRFGKGEIRRAKAYFGFGSEHFLCEVKKHLPQIGERNILVHIQSFHLMKEAMRPIGDSFVSVGTPGANDANRGLCLFHHPALDTGRMRAKDDIGAMLDEECVLHITSRMVFGEIHRREYMPIVLYLRPVGDTEAEAGKDLADLLLHQGDRMACSESRRV